MNPHSTTSAAPLRWSPAEPNGSPRRALLGGILIVALVGFAGSSKARSAAQSPKQSAAQATAQATAQPPAQSAAARPRPPAQRAKPPEFDAAEVSRVFFSDLSDAFRGPPPTLAKLRQSNLAGSIASQTASRSASGETSAPGDEDGSWRKLVSAASLEDEIKRLKLRYDGVITNPGAFNGGGYQDARLNLSAMATLFAVVSQYDDDVRWKTEAALARDLMARTARNCAAGSTQVYNEAKLRKADLQDLVSGASLSSNKPVAPENDWSMIADRSPLMQYVEELLGELSSLARDEASVAESTTAIIRQAEVIAMLGEVLIQEGMDDSGDEDYAAFSRAMTRAAQEVVESIRREDFSAARAAVDAIKQSCTDCHADYRG